ncbi:hypothetical protein Bca52824_001180 [Brassica carinata]|uniref:poly(A)-specific ribonuclease n=1 Tax=Brassica carinata TaxID=52824 RepID=A0A8X7WJM7_BRACI|nr:hypothetical protein Bca52824_001180 [Brassica carinata]
MPSGGAIAREVWAENLESEFEVISGVVDDFPFVSMNTEFHGVIFKSDLRRGNPADLYSLLKSNVDALSLIQVGLTLSDSDRNLPDLGDGQRISTWLVTHTPGFASRPARDRFWPNAKAPISEVCGADDVAGLVCNEEVSWVTFHSAYDFGYLMKILTRRELPCALGEFHRVMRALFGERVYNVKHMMRFCERRLYGGLDRVARTLEVNREVGKCHQAVRIVCSRRTHFRG